MINDLEQYKKYWAYEGILWNLNIGKRYTFLFDNKDNAIDYADRDGAFEHCSCKESYIDTLEDRIFQVLENEIKDYSPVRFMSKEQ